MPNWNIVKTMRELSDKSKDDKSAVEVIAKPERQEMALLERGVLDIAKNVAPDGVDWERDWFRVGDDFTATLYIHVYPSQVEDAWLRPLLAFEYPLDICLYVQPLPIKQFLQKQQQQLARDKASVHKEMEDGVRPNAKKLSRIADIEELLDAVQNDVSHPYQLMTVMTIRAESEKELNKAVDALEGRITAAQTRRVRWKHKQGFETTLPLMTNELLESDTVRTMHTQGLMAAFPFTSSDITHETGVLMGISRSNRTPIIVNRFAQPPDGNLESPNSAILGKSGSGKSYLAKMEMLRWLYRGVSSIVLDPSGEYKRVCAGLGGQNITISLDSPDRINPLDFAYAVEPGRNALRNKIAAMTDLLMVMLRSGPDRTLVDPVSKTLFNNALVETYRAYGYQINDEASQQNATSENMPTLSEVWKMLQRIGRSNRDPQIQEKIRPLLAALTNFVGEGPLAGLFDHRSTVDLKSHFINFDISAITKMGDDFVPLAMQLVLEFLRTSLFTDKQAEGLLGNKLLYVDEAQFLMAHPETKAFLQGTSRTCRKYGIGLTVMTQDVGVFVLDEHGNENKAGRAILANCSCTVLLKQHPNELGAVQQAFSLTAAEVTKLSSARIGEGLIIVGAESAWFSAQGMTHDNEHRMLETSMQARAIINREESSTAALLDDADDELLALQPPSPPGADHLPPAEEEPYLNPNLQLPAVDDGPFETLDD
jgi:type IV secretory pathway VirB4 component